MKLYAIAAVAALAVTACARQPEPEPQTLTVSDVRVSADLTAVSTQQAAAVWGGLERDLSSAIASQFVGQTSPEGWIVSVDVDEIALSGLLASQLGADDARLSGAVTLVDPTTGEAARTYNVSASANQAAALLPPGTDAVAVSPSSAEFYQAVLSAFATGVAETVRAGT